MITVDEATLPLAPEGYQNTYASGYDMGYVDGTATRMVNAPRPVREWHPGSNFASGYQVGFLQGLVGAAHRGMNNAE